MSSISAFSGLTPEQRFDAQLAQAIMNSEKTALQENDKRIAEAFSGNVPSKSAKRKKNEFELKIVNQPGDGNCLFHSLTGGLPKVLRKQYTHKKMRKDICEYLENHAQDKKVQNLICDTLKAYGKKITDVDASCKKYIEKMQKLGKWGASPEIYAYTRIFQAKVLVYQEFEVEDEEDYMGVGFQNDLYKLDDENSANFSVKLQYEDGNHYNLIKNKKHKSS